MYKMTQKKLHRIDVMMNSGSFPFQHNILLLYFCDKLWNSLLERFICLKFHTNCYLNVICLDNFEVFMTNYFG